MTKLMFGTFHFLQNVFISLSYLLAIFLEDMFHIVVNGALTTRICTRLGLGSGRWLSLTHWRVVNNLGLLLLRLLLLLLLLLGVSILILLNMLRLLLPPLLLLLLLGMVLLYMLSRSWTSLVKDQPHRLTGLLGRMMLLPWRSSTRLYEIGTLHSSIFSDQL